VVRQKLLKECKRPGFAAVARYLKPIGKGVEGPSIRFAETAIRVMTNISTDSMAIYDDREKRIVRILVTDCETNTPYSSDVTVEKTVERRSVKDGDEVMRTRTNRQGNMVYIIQATEDDLLNKQNAMISKAIRNNGLRLIPGDIIEECMDQVFQTLRATDAQDPDLAKRKLFDAFETLGVKVADLKSYLGREEVGILTQAETMELRGLYAAIKDGQTTWREVIEAKLPQSSEPERTGTQAVKERLQKRKEPA
jgi:hypothetical protein